MPEYLYLLVTPQGPSNRFYMTVLTIPYKLRAVSHLKRYINSLFYYIPLLKQLGVSRFLLDLGILPSKQFKQSSKNNDSTFSTYIKPTLIYNITQNRQSSYSIYIQYSPKLMHTQKLLFASACQQVLAAPCWLLVLGSCKMQDPKNFFALL